MPKNVKALHEGSFCILLGSSIFLRFVFVVFAENCDIKCVMGKDGKKASASEPKEGKKESAPDKEQEALSLEQKLFMIDQELRALHQCCINQGYTPLQIHQVSGLFPLTSLKCTLLLLYYLR